HPAAHGRLQRLADLRRHGAPSFRVFSARGTCVFRLRRVGQGLQVLSVVSWEHLLRIIVSILITLFASAACGGGRRFFGGNHTRPPGEAPGRLGPGSFILRANESAPGPNPGRFAYPRIRGEHRPVPLSVGTSPHARGASTRRYRTQLASSPA